MWSKSGCRRIPWRGAAAPEIEGGGASARRQSLVSLDASRPVRLVPSLARGEPDPDPNASVLAPEALNLRQLWVGDDRILGIAGPEEPIPAIPGLEVIDVGVWSVDRLRPGFVSYFFPGKCPKPPRWLV